MSPRGLSLGLTSAAMIACAGCHCAQCGRSEQTAAPPAHETPLELVEAFPHVRIDRDARIVEFDAQVTPLMHFPDTPVVWLEVLVTTPDTKPHETLLVTDAKPSHVHAALLLTGVEAGEPGLVWVDASGSLKRQPPNGPDVQVRFHYDDPTTGQPRAIDPRAWVVGATDGARFDPARQGRFVFAGSRFGAIAGQEVYVADYEGTLLGLVTFGTETVAWHEPYSHEAQIDEPEWIADVARIPPNGWPVRVRLSVE